MQPGSVELLESIAHVFDDVAVQVVENLVDPAIYEATALLEHLEANGSPPPVLFPRVRSLDGSSGEFGLLFNAYGALSSVAAALHTPAETWPALLKDYVKRVRVLNEKIFMNRAKFARALSAWKGEELYYDANFTLRGTFGQVRGLTDLEGRETVFTTRLEGLFRIAQESLRNIRKHSGVEAAELSLRRADGQVVLEVSDRGRGFQSSAARGGIGLHSIRERMALVGGTASVQSQPGSGTTVRASVPIPG